MITAEEIKHLEESFPKFKEDKVTTKPCRIKFNGQLIRTSSGKTIWRKKGFAKSALLNHIEGVRPLPASCYRNAHGSLYKDSSKIKEMIRYLEDIGVIEYVEAETEDFAQQPK